MLILQVVCLLASLIILIVQYGGLSSPEGKKLRRFSRMKIDDYIQMAIDEVKQEDNITAVLFNVKVSIPKKEREYLFSKVASGKIGIDEYIEQIEEKEEKRIVLSYDDPQEGHSKMILDQNEFLQNNAYLSYNEIYNSFRAFNAYEELMEHKDGLKIAMKQKLAEHFANILTR